MTSDKVSAMRVICEEQKKKYLHLTSDHQQCSHHSFVEKKSRNSILIKKCEEKMLPSSANTTIIETKICGMINEPDDDGTLFHNT